MSDPMLLSPGTRKITPARPAPGWPGPDVVIQAGPGLQVYITSNSHSEYPYWVARAVPYIRM